MVILISGIFSGSFFDNLEWPFFKKLRWQKRIIRKFMQVYILLVGSFIGMVLSKVLFLSHIFQVFYFVSYFIYFWKFLKLSMLLRNWIMFSVIGGDMFTRKVMMDLELVMQPCERFSELFQGSLFCLHSPKH